MMTGQEVRQLTEHLEDMPEAEDAEDLSHVRSTSDAVSTAALEAAPRGPWHLETASAKPKMSRKLAPHLSRMSIQVLLQVLRRRRHLTKIVLLCLGAGTVTELSRLGRRLSSRMTCHMNHSLGCLNGANKLSQHGMQADKKTILHHMTIFTSLMLRFMIYMLIFCRTLMSSLLARYLSTGTLTLTPSSTPASRRQGSLDFAVNDSVPMIRSIVLPYILENHQAGITQQERSHTKYHVAGRSPYKGSRTGPKSGHQLSRPRVSTKILATILWLCLIHINMATTTELIDARVGAASVTAPGAASAAKLYGARKASERPSSTFVHRYLKRAYQRAYARACREGGAHCKGKWYPMEWFTRTPLRTQALRTRHSPQTSCPHWTVISWNAAGLTAATFQEIETYARTVRADIFMLQETNWNFESTWSSQEYHYVRAAGDGKRDRLAGLLVMISTRHAKAEQIQYCVHHAGRLLHIRTPHRHTHIDVVNWYQYAVNQQDGTIERRQKLLIIRLQQMSCTSAAQKSTDLGRELQLSMRAVRQRMWLSYHSPESTTLH